MWAYVYDGEKVAKAKVPVPAIRANDVLVKIHKASICGSDLHIFMNDDWAKETIDKGMVIGHEGCGSVEKVGADVVGLKSGDYVALESHYACPACEREGKTADHCPHYGIMGLHGSRGGEGTHQVGGVFSEFTAVPAYCAHKISDSIREKISASLLEPAGNSWEIIRFLRERKLPENFAVYGCGPHGLNMQLFARYVGVKNVLAFEVDPWRHDFAKSFGAAHHVLNPKTVTHEEVMALTNGKGFDVAIDMVGNISVVKECKELVHHGGMLILFGLPRHEVRVAHGENFSQIIFNNEESVIRHKGKELMLRGFTGRREETWKELIPALEESEFLREKLSLPLDFLGSLHELENFISNPPEKYLKMGLRAF